LGISIQKEKSMPDEKNALITGGSGGIGLELARILGRHGYDLIIVSKNQQKLVNAAEEIRRESDIRITTMAADLANPSVPLEIYSQIAAKGISIDILINNAGFGTYGNFYKTGLAVQLEMIQLNIMSLTQLTHLFLPQMIDRGRGYIMNVASTAAFQPGPLMAVYYASKAYVLNFSEAIANELKETSIKVTALCPGPTRTGFQRIAGIEESRLIKSGKMMDARKVAEIGFRGMMAGHPVVIPGALNKIQIFGVRLLPRQLIVEMARWIQESRK
jgi:uncharacterized protein